MIAVVVAGHRHDGSRSIAGQHIFGNIDRYILFRERITCIGAGKLSGHFLHLRHAVAFTAALYIFYVFLHLLIICRCGDVGNQRVLRSEHHKCGAMYRIRSRSKNAYLRIGAVHRKIHQRPFTLTYPVALHLFHTLTEIHPLQSFQKTIGKCGDAQEPLPHAYAFHRMTAALAQSVLHLIVGQHRSQRFAPPYFRMIEISETELHEKTLTLLVRHRLPFIGANICITTVKGDQARAAFLFEEGNERIDRRGGIAEGIIPAIEELHEYPLCPFIVLGITSLHLTAPVVAEAHALQLLPEVGDVLLGSHGGMLTGLDGILLGGESERVEAHGMEHVKALQALVA